MSDDFDKRACELGEYMVQKGCTVRAAAKKFDISKSTVHKDVSERLRYIDFALYEKVKTVLEKNKAERHMRGGEATKQKYQNIAEAKAVADKSK
ncbi:MAG: sporulation transcriptional regulator SpoIIID [Clostridiales bacterium]|nr:sporulation transcriptional regulator SpoIIID [Clostridiales bacterium]